MSRLSRRVLLLSYAVSLVSGIASAAPSPATTPAPHSFFADGRGAGEAHAMVLTPTGSVLILQQSPFSIQEFTDAGQFHSSVVPTLDRPAIALPNGVLVLADGRLLVSDPFGGRLLVFSAERSSPVEIHALTWEDKRLPPAMLAQNAAGDLFVSAFGMMPGRNGVFRLDAKQFTAQAPFIPGGAGGSTFLGGIAVGPDGQFYAADMGSGAVLRFDGKTGAYLSIFASIGRIENGGLAGIAFAPDGSLYAIERKSASILRFDGKSGSLLGEVVPPGVLKRPAQLAFTHGGDLLVLDIETQDIYRFPSPVKSVATVAGARGPAPHPMPTTCLALGRPSDFAPTQGEKSGLLARELLRQAVSMAARDLGATTRDAVLREPTDSAACLQVEVQTVVTLRSARLTLLKSSKPFPSVLGTWEITLPGGEDLDYLALGEQAERLVPNLTKVLITAGLIPATRSATASDARGADHLDMVRRFDTARRAHAALLRKPADPAALTDLVRSYADLSWLIGPATYSAAYKVIQARSLLYAERLVRLAPGPASSGVRAYALAFLGLHGAAIRDLAAARGFKDDPRLATLQSYCDYDVASLMNQAAKPEIAELASTLAFDAVDNDGSSTLLEKAATAALTANPDDLSAYRALIGVGSLGIKGAAIAQVSARFEQALLADLEALPDLPQPVAHALGVFPGLGPDLSAVVKSIDRRVSAGAGGRERAGPENLFLRSKVAELLVAAEVGDTGEPSFAVLGRMVQEEDFLEALGRVMYVKDTLGSPVEDDLRRLEPLLAGHPYRGIADGYALDFAREPERYRKLLDSVVPTDAVPRLRFFADFLETVGNATEKEAASTLHRRVAGGADDTASDVLWNADGDSLDGAKRLQRISPKSPLAVARLIKVDWPSVEPQAKEMENRFGDHVVVLSAFAEVYSRLKRYDDAERVLRRYVRAVPDAWAYDTLADNYLAQGRADAWQAALDEFIARRPPGLDGPRAQVTVAAHFNELGDYAKARPYAEAAAESYAAWAMEAAAESCEGAGDYSCAEKWKRATSLRYDDNALDWYIWCKRTGHGDEKAALARARESIAAIGASASTEDLEEFAIIALLAGDNETARKHFGEAFEKLANPYDGLFVAALSAEHHDAAAADRAFDRIAAESPKFKFGDGPRFLLIQAGPLAQDFIAGKITAEAFEQSAEMLWANDQEGERANLEYFLARFLAIKGETARATKHLVNVASSKRQDKWTSIMARSELRAHGLEPAPGKPPRASN